MQSLINSSFVMFENNTALISVILPTYNRAHLLPTAIESVMEQTYHNWELIIIDDGSTDNTGLVAGRYVKGDSRIRYFYQENKGGGAARNTGMKYAKGQYITFLDSDDRCLARKLQAQLKKITSLPDCRIVLCQCRFVREHKEIFIKKPVKSFNVFEGLLSGQPGVYSQTPLLFVGRDLIREHHIQFDERLPALQDFDFLLSLSRYANYEVVDEVLYEMTHHNEAHIHTARNVCRARVILYEKYSDFFRSHDQADERWVRKCVKLIVYNNYNDQKLPLMKLLKPGLRKTKVRLLFCLPDLRLLKRLACNLLI